jgi:hypothetical protein
LLIPPPKKEVLNNNKALSLSGADSRAAGDVLRERERERV